MLSTKALNQDFDMRFTFYVFKLSFVLWFFFLFATIICIHKYNNELLELTWTLVFVVYCLEGDKHK